MERIKAILFSATGMKIVNVSLFFLSAFLRNRGVKFVTYFVWVLYLAAAIRNTSDKTRKTVYLGMVLYAITMIAFNVYFLWLRWNRL